MATLYESPCEDIGDLLPFNPRILMRQIDAPRTIAKCARCQVEAMERISAMLVVTPAPISEITPSPKGTRKYKSHRAYGAETWRQKGGMMGGSSGACRGATSNNGTGIVPQAFCKS